jgi:NADPH2:quinone reductase
VRAVVVGRAGPDAVARLCDVPEPEPGAGQVQVHMQYASVNPADWKCRSGWMLGFPQFRPACPLVLGFDGVGVVTALGSGVTDRRIGDRVCVRADQMAGQHGTFAEVVCVARTDTALVPDDVPGEHAATIPVAGVTAWQALTTYAQLEPGQRVLVNGAAGGVGSFAVQFARYLGARVAGTARSANAGYLRELGCEVVVDYRSEDVCRAVRGWAPAGVDVVLDTVHVLGVPGVERMVSPGGQLVGVVTLGEPEPYAGRDDLSFVAATVKRNEAADDMAVIGRLLAEGRVRVPAVEVVSLDEVPAALDRIGAGHVRGKIVVAIRPEGPVDLRR